MTTPVLCGGALLVALVLGVVYVLSRVRDSGPGSGRLR